MASQIPVWLDCDPGIISSFRENNSEIDNILRPRCKSQLMAPLGLFNPEEDYGRPVVENSDITLYNLYQFIIYDTVTPNSVETNISQDAFAILLIATHPSLLPLGISTIHGNSSVDHTTQNALSLLTSFGPKAQRIAVYRGVSKGLARPSVHAPAIHGESGLDGTDLLPTPTIQAKEGSAVDALADAILAQEKDVAWIVATGALTNVALAFKKYPQLAEHVKGVSIMGGAIGNGFTEAQLGTVDGIPRIGNWSVHAEFNILVDPEAAAFILEHPIVSKKTTLIPLDITHLVQATSQVQQLLLHGQDGKQETRLRRMLVELLTFFADTYKTVFGIGEGPPLHDPIAVAVLLDTIEALEFDYRGGQRYTVHVVTGGSHEDAQNGAETGRTIATLLPNGEEGVRIPRGLNVARFWAVTEQCLQLADKDNRL